jgi:hypothetical protein
MIFWKYTWKDHPSYHPGGGLAGAAESTALAESARVAMMTLEKSE